MLGLALAVAFVACFITGLVSHLIQHPLNVGFLSWPARPGWLYRWNQGLHVAAGTAAIPLLLAKLWAVYDQLWTFPPAKTLGHALERLLVAPLVAGSVFLLFTGLANTAHWYPWPFAFPGAHFWASWIVIGALVAHIGASGSRRVARSAAIRPWSPSVRAVALTAAGSCGRPSAAPASSPSSPWARPSARSRSSRCSRRASPASARRASPSTRRRPEPA